MKNPIITLHLTSKELLMLEELQKDLTIFNRSRLIRHCIKSFYRRRQEQKENKQNNS